MLFACLANSEEETTLTGGFFVIIRNTAKHRKTPYSLYIFLKSIKKIFFWSKVEKMLFCCIVFLLGIIKSILRTIQHFFYLLFECCFAVLK